MKKILIVLMLIFPVTLLAQNVSYIVKGKVGNVNAPAKVYLGYKNAPASFMDSAVIKNGQFEFKGTINEPVQATLVLSYAGAGPRSWPAQSIVFYLESGNINISSPDSLVHAIITGANINSDNEKLKDTLKATDKKMAALLAEYSTLPVDKKKDKAFIAGFMKDYIKRQKIIILEQSLVEADFIKKNPNSIVSLNAIKMVAKYIPESSKYSILAPLFNSLSPDVKNMADGKAYAKELERMKVIAVGSMAPQFTQKDPDGKPIKLSSFQGKYVLVDFWASWCTACRAENPNVVKAYNKYHDKGLEILGVSLDNEKSKDAWLAAIQKDGLIWNHVSDLKGWKNEVAAMYSISSIPQNVLLDKTGKIIGKNLRGEELNKKLEEIFK